MTALDLRVAEAARRHAERTRRAQGLPAHVTDPGGLEELVELVDGGSEAAIIGGEERAS